MAGLGPPLSLQACRLTRLDFSMTDPKGVSDCTNLQRDLPVGGQLSTTAGKLGNSETHKMSGWGKLPLSLTQGNL